MNTYINELYFNSIKVRLEHVFLSGETSIKNTFQFHKGTIRTSQP